MVCSPRVKKSCLKKILRCFMVKCEFNLGFQGILFNRRSSEVSTRKNSKRTKLKIFLALLAAVIITVVVLVWHFYALSYILTVTDGTRAIAKVDVKTKQMTILSSRSEPLIIVDLDFGGKVSESLSNLHECTSEKNPNSLCLTWDQLNASVVVSAQQFGYQKNSSDIHCVKVAWYTNVLHLPNDCIHLVSPVKNTQTVWFGSHDYIVYNSSVTGQETCIPFIPGGYSPVNAFGKVLKNQGANVIEPVWFASVGAAVKVSNRHASRVCQNFTTANPKLCIEPMFDQTHQEKSHNDRGYYLDYMVCTADNVLTVFEEITKQFVRPKRYNESVVPSFQGMVNDGTFYEDHISENFRVAVPDNSSLVNSCEALLNQPLWNFACRISGVDVGLLIEHLGHLRHIGGTVHYRNVTQVFSKFGDFVLQNDKHREGENFLTAARSLGLDVMLPATPFVNYDAQNFGFGAQSNFFLLDISENAPMLISFMSDKQLFPAVLDLTSSGAVLWFSEEVDRLKTLKNVSFFQFYFGQSTWLPKSEYRLAKPLHNIGHFSTLYADLAARIGGCSVTDVAYDSQGLNQFVLLSPANSMRETLSAVLAAGIAGYPFVVPSFPSSLYEASKAMDSDSLIEGIFRWIEMVSFFPVMHIPWDFDVFIDIKLDTNLLVNFTKHYLKIRNSDDFFPKFQRAVQVAESNRSLPVVAPMWMSPGALEASSDKNRLLLIEDQFMIGPDMFVAPILDIGARARTIYIPPGKWKDIVDHRETESTTGKWMNEYPVDLHKIPIFVRVDLQM